MPSFIKSTKDKLLDHSDPVTTTRREREPSSSRGFPRHRDKNSEDPREVVTIIEPHDGSTRKDSAKDDDWDGVYDGPRRRKTSTIYDLHRKWSLPGGYSLQLLRDINSPPSSHDHSSIKTDHRSSKERSALSPRSSRDHNDRERGSRDQHYRSHERSGGRDSAPPRSEERHHRRRRKSSHPKELSNYRSSNNRVDEGGIPAISPVPLLTGTPDSFVVEEWQRLDGEALEKLDKEYQEKKKQKASNEAAASQARKHAEDETTQKRPNRLVKKKDADREDRKRVELREQKNAGEMYLQAAPKMDKTPAPREHLSDSGDSAISELNRKFGESTRTYLEGMVPAEEVAKAIKKQREEQREEARRRGGQRQ